MVPRAVFQILVALRALFSRKPSEGDARLDELCEFAPAGGPLEQRVYWLVRLVDWLGKDPTKVRTRARFFAQTLERNPTWRDAVSGAFGSLVREVDVDVFLAHGGIPDDYQLSSLAKTGLRRRVLPTACRTTDVGEIFVLAVRGRDLLWIGDGAIVETFAALLDDQARSALSRALDRAAVDVAHQIVASAHHPSIRGLDEGARSPFPGLFGAVSAVVEAPADLRVRSALRGRIRECERAIREYRAGLVERGADVATTFLLLLMEQQLDRLRTLSELFTPSFADVGSAVRQLAIAAKHGHRGVLDRSSALLVQNLVDSTAAVGKHYLSRESSSVAPAFIAGVGGGAIMALATLFKFLLSELHAPALYQGLVYGMNYAACFCAAYLLHFTIATKLPAHTAAALARSVQTGGGHKRRVARFVGVWRATVRLQLAGLFGNLVAVAPVALGLDAVHRAITGHHVLDGEHAREVLDATSLLGPSVLYAAVAGVLLWMSSLLGASVDNWVRVSRLSDALATSVVSLRTVGSERAYEWASRWVPRLGGLAGNAALGFLLALVPIFFYAFALPVEIRHVTVSAGSVTLAFAAGGAQPAPLVLAVLGILAIAFTNVTVSFALALWLALRPSETVVAAHAAPTLLRIGLRRWLTGKAPRDDGGERSPTIHLGTTVVPAEHQAASR